MACKTDKNLGPALIDRAHYIQSAFKDHLLHATTYEQLSRQNAEQEMLKTSSDLMAWLCQYKNNLTKSKYTYLTRTHQLYDNKGNIMFPQFYLLAKIHKQPLAT